MHTEGCTRIYLSVAIGAGSQMLTTCCLGGTELHSSSTIGTKSLSVNICSTGRTRCHILTHPLGLTNLPSIL